MIHTMNKFFLIVLLSFTINPLIAQLSLSGNAVANVQFRDANGRILSTGENSIKGSPYVFEQFGLGKVTMSNGLEAVDSNLNFSFFDHQLYFLKDKGLYFVNQPFNAFSITSKDAENNTIEKLFANGYPSFDQNTAKTFYEIVVKTNNLQLLKYSKAFVKESTPYGSAPIKEYSIDHTYYIYINASKQLSLVGSSTSAKNLKKALPTYAAAIDHQIDQLHLNLKKESDVRMLLEKLQ